MACLYNWESFCCYNEELYYRAIELIAITNVMRINERNEYFGISVEDKTEYSSANNGMRLFVQNISIELLQEALCMIPMLIVELSYLSKCVYKKVILSFFV